MRSASAALGLLAAAALASASDVQQLHKDTFPDFIKEHDLVLAEFFAPWCGHCKALAPEYEQAATELKEKNIPLVKIDCTEDSDLCKEHGVEGYPTVKVFRGADNVTPYKGARKAPAIVSFMTKQALPAVTTLTSKTLDDFKGMDKVVVVAYFAADDKSSNETFTSVAEGLRDDYLFGATSDADLAKAAGVKQPAVVMYKSFDEGVAKYSGKIEKDGINEFVRTASVPLVGEVGPETYAAYMAAGKPLAYIFAETPEEREKLAEELKPIAEKQKSKINFATIDAKAFGAHAGNLNLEAGKWPAFAIQDVDKNQKFPYDQEKKITKKNIEKFVEDYLKGKIEPSIKSQPIPEKQEGPVTVVVAHTYQDLIIDNDKDVLLEFYAPWCGHCKALAPTYEEFAALYFNNPEFSEKVTIAKIDATNNDVPEDITGFPTIKFYPAGSKDTPIDYKGARTVEALANFIKENGKHQVDAYVAPAETPEEAEAEEGKPTETVSTTAEETEGVKETAKSKVSKATEAVKTAVADTDEDASHDEL